MNIAKIMIPKISTVFLHEKDTIRQGLEQYIGSVTEGDFLRHLLVCQTTDLKVQEGYRLGSIVRRDFCPALQIDADSEQVVTSMLNQNFVPIVDGRNALCGILTRKRLIEFLAQARDKTNTSCIFRRP
ncbi:CBS domain-containing protein [Phascolarctobacterium succinatutens]|uniref:CBS domain-containing protein n=1 Tax=Phascolarctobacterium succinatutens TaxID=626940 RepID=UPI003F7F6271